MKLTSQRISHLSHQVLDALTEQGLMTVADRADALSVLKEALEKQARLGEAIDAMVRDKLRKQKKIPGSREWQILYDKYVLEERGKKGW